MKTRLYRIISCICVILLLLVSLIYISKIEERKDSSYKYKPFFEHSKDYDVLFLGSSHTVNTMYPMELWKDHGISSYNLAGDGNALATTYWVFENALDYASPSIVVVDCYLLSMNDKSTIKYEYVHKALDAFPISVTKYRAAKDFTDDPQRDIYVTENPEEVTGEKPSVISLLWDYSVYHSRWNELGESDFVNTGTKQFGAEYRANVAVPVESLPDTGKTLDTDTLAMEYLEKIITECQSRNISVLLTYLPYPADETAWEEANSADLIADKYGIDYINFLNLNIVDLETDCCDATSHLNPSGGRKLTDYVGDYLVHNYDTIDHRNDPHYDYWNDNYTEYNNMKIDVLNKQSDLSDYLMLLADKNLSCTILAKTEYVRENKTLLSLIHNLGADITSVEHEYIRINKTDEIVTVDECSVNEISELGDNNISVYVYDFEDKTDVVSTYTE